MNTLILKSKSIVLLFFSVVSPTLFSQSFELKNEKLIQYYQLINEAEINITQNNLEKANQSYKSAFNILENPPAKDLYNDMIVSIKLKDYQSAFYHYQTLKLLKYGFTDHFYDNNFPKNIKYKKLKKTINFDNHYKKQLDSLFVIDQHYRNFSKGDYANYRKEITKSDSIAATRLQQLIHAKGFPNEYDISLESANKVFFQNFYFIIWHQLKTNLYSPQQVNFSDDVVQALDKGKISPEDASFLLELLTGTQDYSMDLFSIHKFLSSNGGSQPIYDQIKNKMAKEDCCYISKFYLPEKRDAYTKKLINEVNKKRTKIGLCTIDDDLKKKIFSLKNDDYKFSNVVIKGVQFTEDNDMNMFKEHLIKITD